MPDTTELGVGSGEVVVSTTFPLLPLVATVKEAKEAPGTKGPETFKSSGKPGPETISPIAIPPVLPEVLDNFKTLVNSLTPIVAVTV